MLFRERAEVRGEEICDMVSIGSQATLMSRRFLLDNSKRSAILIGKTSRSFNVDREIEKCDAPTSTEYLDKSG
jgi:hypothetical protein